MSVFEQADFDQPKFQTKIPSGSFELGQPATENDWDASDESVSLELKLVDPKDVIGSSASPIVIGVPTFRRPKSLINTLNSLAALETDLCFTILVADNDAEGNEGLEAVERLKQLGYRWSIESVSVPERGISQVRNALVERAFADPATSAIVMVDDEQWVDPDWLDQLVAMQRRTKADVVGNRVVADFQCEVPRWANGLYVFGLCDRPGGPCSVIDGTGGVLLTRNVVELANGFLFDVEFSMSGGGDSEFFARIKNQGAQFAFSDLAVAHEVIDQTRMNKRWARRRAFRIGIGYMRIQKRHGGGGLSLFKEYFSAAVAACVSPLMILAHWSDPRKRMNDSLLFFRNLGKLSSLFAFKVNEYKTTIGS